MKRSAMIGMLGSNMKTMETMAGDLVEVCSQDPESEVKAKHRARLFRLNASFLEWCAEATCLLEELKE